jgi:hypothetical protein
MVRGILATLDDTPLDRRGAALVALVAASKKWRWRFELDRRGKRRVATSSAPLLPRFGADRLTRFAIKMR